MQLSKYKRKFVLTVFSVFIIWHAIGIAIVGPFHSSHFRDSFMEVYQDYLLLIRANRTWHFYSPNPGRGRILSYETISDSGENERYPLTQARHKFDHAYFRYTNFYAYLFRDSDYTARQGYDEDVADYLCSLHKDKDIVAVRFTLRNQKTFSPLDYRNGKRALDDEFLENEQFFGPFRCSC